MSEAVLVSACLLGLSCRYDGSSREIPDTMKQMLEQKVKLIPVCPEQLGGLPTPRPKSIVAWNKDMPKVINEEGRKVTEEFRKGATETLMIARLFECRKAYLKTNSPSCGDKGITTRMLANEGFEIIHLDSPRKTD